MLPQYWGWDLRHLKSSHGLAGDIALLGWRPMFFTKDRLCRAAWVFLWHGVCHSPNGTQEQGRERERLSWPSPRSHIVFLSLLFGRSKWEERRIRVCCLITVELWMFQVKWCAPLVIATWVTQGGRVSQSNWKPSWKGKKCAPCGGKNLHSQHLGGRDWQFLSWRPAWNIWWVPGQPELHSETLKINE